MNEESVQYLSPMDLDRLKVLKKESDLLWVAERNGVVEAFIIAFREGAEYDSVNFQWFEHHFDNFLYVDRVVVDIAARGAGLGNLIYDAVFDYARGNSVARITAEIDIEPANPLARIPREIRIQGSGRQSRRGTKSSRRPAAGLNRKQVAGMAKIVAKPS